MNEPTNQERAEWGRAAIDAFAQGCATDSEDCLRDLLCDLMHWADQNQHREDFESFECALNAARRHYAEEKKREAQVYADLRKQAEETDHV